MPTKKSRHGAKSPLNVPWFVVLPGVALALAGHFIAPLGGAWYALTDSTGFGSYNFVGLSNFVTIFTTPEDRGTILTTVRLAFAFVVCVTLVGFLLAVALNRVVRWPGNALRSVFFIPAVMIPLSVTQVWKFVLDYDGPLNIALRGVGLESWTRNWLGDFTFAPWMILIVMVWQYSGYAMVIIHAGLQVIPEDLHEAASLDGVNTRQRLRYLTIPLLAPSITIVVVLMTITGLRAFDQIIGLTGGGPVGTTDTLASRFYQVTWVDGQYGYGTSMALLLTVLVVFVGVIQVKVLREREENIRG